VNASELKSLSSLGILSGLSRSQLDSVLAICCRVKFASGEVIMKEGELGDTMYFFVEGQVKVTKELTLKVGRAAFSQADKSMVTIKPGPSGVFGDMAMFGDEPRSATITAVGECVLYEIKRDLFTGLCERDPELGVRLLRRVASVLCERIRKGNSDVLKLSTALSLALSK
jgi:CRP-like cAMP-binding protein